ncbi:hypothetical protein [Asticcacaulis sp. AND118]|uniref:hypothetical protein n=1 Tax=Asticcacaulis sp. AND118 TaxID=2840468 RepID=UPI001D00063E|nr:hypothetical protein [Asticcacaulis sp. AND118]UDF03854.1 hypothetical protein LH365_02065 [Asticcacaulis sp. AND118]
MKTDKNLILRVKLIALGVFILASAGILVYGGLYEMPRRKCEANGGWWSNKYRSCETPIYLPLLTKRKPGEQQKILWPTKDAMTASDGSPKPVDNSAALSASASASASASR